MYKSQSGILKDRGQLEAFAPREMTSPHQILVEPLPDRAGALVQLPRAWNVRQRFRETFRRRVRLVPIAPWCWRVLGQRAVLRAEQFAAEVAAELERERRRHAWKASQTEWGD